MSASELWRKFQRRSQSNLYFALAFLPRRQRDAFRDVYRFLRVADDLVDEDRVALRAPLPADAERAFAIWRHELDGIYAGNAQHPDAVRLGDAVRRFRLPRAPFDAILNGIQSDLGRPHYQTWHELRAYCEAVASSLGYLCLAIFCDGDPAAADPHALAYARELGIALQLANILRDVADDARRGRIYLPAEDLARFGVSEREILEGRMTRGYAALAAFECRRARELVAAARAELAQAPALGRRLLVAEIWADVYLALLCELERKHFDVWGGHAYLPRRRKLVLALRRLCVSRLPAALASV